jgi:hypothetical protein
MNYTPFGSTGKRLSWINGIILMPIIVIGILTCALAISIAINNDTINGLYLRWLDSSI